MKLGRIHNTVNRQREQQGILGPEDNNTWFARVQYANQDCEWRTKGYCAFMGRNLCGRILNAKWDSWYTSSLPGVGGLLFNFCWNIWGQVCMGEMSWIRILFRRRGKPGLYSKGRKTHVWKESWKKALTRTHSLTGCRRVTGVILDRKF